MLQQEFIFEENENDCHASTVLELAGNRFLAAWFEGKKEGDDSCAIRFAIREENGVWTLPRTAAKVEPVAHWNPVLFRNDLGEIFLYFKVGRQIADWKTYVMSSSDEAVHWSTPVELVPGDDSGGRGPVKNPPILNSAGHIVAPASTEREGRWRAFVDISADHGKSWMKSAEIPIPEVRVDDRYRHYRLGTIQPALWESADGTLHMFLRSNNHAIYRSESHDGGISWCEAYPTKLPNNNSGLSLTQFRGGRLLLAANLCASNWGCRHILSLIASDDNGETWSKPVTLAQCLPGDIRPGVQAEFSYPTLITQSDEKHFALTYTWHRKKIVFATGDADMLFPG